MTVTLSVYG